MPKYIFIENPAIPKEEILEKISKASLNYPLIFKIKNACDDENSHNIGVAINEAGILELAESNIFSFFIFLYFI